MVGQRPMQLGTGGVKSSYQTVLENNVGLPTDGVWIQTYPLKVISHKVCWGLYTLKLHTHTYIYIYICVCVCVCVCMCVCVCVCVF